MNLKFKPKINFKPYSKINSTNIALISGSGLIIGTIIGVLSEFLKIEINPKNKLPIPTPNIEFIEIELVNIFNKFVGTFYNLCPEKNKKKYKYFITQSIIHAEEIMLIEHQLIKEEINKDPSNKTKSNALAFLCMKNLRNCEKLFNSEMIINIKDYIDIIFVIIANHVQNINILNSNF